MNQNSGDAHLRIGVSSCLLGEKVRYNGGHKLDNFITGTLGRHATLVGVCPEVEYGLPVPRQAMHLRGDPAAPQLVLINTGLDLTMQMHNFCQSKALELDKESLSGFIFKSRSPSCGLFSAKVHNTDMPDKNGRGLFADAMASHVPLLPMEEEGRLHDAGIRENFVERMYAYQRWQEFLEGKGPKNLVAFHTSHKYLIMAHSPELYRQMGQLISGSGARDGEALLVEYAQLLMGALSCHASVGNQVNVLMHIMGYFKKELASAEKAELLELICQYHCGTVSLIAPLTLIRHYMVKFDNKYLQRQVYLNPRPLELMLKTANFDVLCKRNR